MRSTDPRDDVAELERRLVEGATEAHVDMVVSSPAPDRYRVATQSGVVTFRRSVEPGDGPGGPRYRFDTDEVVGVDPLQDSSTDKFVGLSEELAHLHPSRHANAYPHAHDQIAQLFDSEHAPDLLVQHPAAHRFGPNLGEHGSLGIVQARGPFIAAGAGVEPRGVVASSARMVDVAPTILRVLGGAAHPDGVGPTGERRPDALLARQDGSPLDALVAHGAARHVVVFLLDGCNANVLADVIAAGEAPAIASLARRGTTLGHGLLASLPTATLANHTTANTGAHPGHSGVIHNMWHDRHRGHTPDLLAMDQMFDAMVHLHSDVETVHQAVHRNRPDAFTAALFEFCDTGADMSTFAAFREGRPPRLPDAATLSGATDDHVAGSGAYAFMSSVDELATRQAVDLWRRVDGNPLPDLTFLSFALTDEAGHEAGPHGAMTRAAIADSDRRVARVLDAVESSGATETTTFLVISDHGMEVADVTVDEPWDEVGRRVLGVDDAIADSVTDVASGWWYVRR